MGALQHSIQKKQHRERSQPEERKRWGLLEKKKDYKLRAADYHSKQAQLKLLKQKAQERNPDEYYHQMTKTRINEDANKVRTNQGQALSHDAVKILKTQDSGYVRTQLAQEQKNIERLQGELIFGGTGKHTVFVDDIQEGRLCVIHGLIQQTNICLAKSFSAAKFFDTDNSMVNRRQNRIRRGQLEKDNRLASKQLKDEDQDELNKKRVEQLRELDQRMNREMELAKVKLEMDLQRELMKKGPKQKITDKDGNVSWKWTQQRKK